MGAAAQDAVRDRFGADAYTSAVTNMYEEFLRDPQSVSESWREFFEGYRPGGANLARPSTPEVKLLAELDDGDDGLGPADPTGSPSAARQRLSSISWPRF